ncbi:hypothetical protein, partial [Prescottella equi]|uniref:hypothetical protein n=2 Tax=Nocardiaceae TaxID=85025 RepID=UPI001F2A85EA
SQAILQLFTGPGARKINMFWLWIALGAWFVLALAAAVLIGRGIRRADSEEIGSTLDWDVTKLDTEDPSQIRDR